MDRKRTFITLAKKHLQAEKATENGLAGPDPGDIKETLNPKFHKLGSKTKQRKQLHEVYCKLEMTNEENLEQLKREQEELERKERQDDDEKKPHKEHKAIKKATKATEKKSAMNANVDDFLVRAAKMEQERKGAALRVKQEQEKQRQVLEQQAEAERLQVKRAARISALEIRRQKNGLRSALGLLQYFVLDKKHSLAVVSEFAQERPVRLFIRAWSNLVNDKRHKKRAEAEFVLRSSSSLLLDVFHAIHQLTHPLGRWQSAVSAREFRPEGLHDDAPLLPRGHELQRLQLCEDASASAAATPFNKQGSKQCVATSPETSSPSTNAPPFLGHTFLLDPGASSCFPGQRLNAVAPLPVIPPDFPDLCASVQARKPPTTATREEPKKEKASWPPASFFRAQEDAADAAKSGVALTSSPEASSEEYMLSEAQHQFREGQQLAKRGDLVGALEFLEISMCMRQGALGQEHPLVADSMFELGTVCLDLGRLQASADLLGRCVELRRKALGERNVETAKCMYHAAIALFSLGACDQALLLMEHATSAFEATVGKGDPRFARALARVLDAM